MSKFTTRNNNTNAATTREIYPRIIRGISIDSPRMAIGHERVRLSRTKHEPPRPIQVDDLSCAARKWYKMTRPIGPPVFLPHRVEKKKKRKTFHRRARKLWSARFRSEIEKSSGPRKASNNSRVIYRRDTGGKPARLFFAYSSKVVRSWITLPPGLPCLLSRWQIKKYSILGPIIHRMLARC